MSGELWSIYDKRTGERLTVGAYLTEERARDGIVAVELLNALGVRHDLAKLVPFMEARRIG